MRLKSASIEALAARRDSLRSALEEIAIDMSSDLSCSCRGNWTCHKCQLPSERRSYRLRLARVEAELATR